MKTLVTGASGFIGRTLCRKLKDEGLDVVACSRTRVDGIGCSYISAPELGPAADWAPALAGIDAVVHLAGQALVDGAANTPDIEAEYKRINVEATCTLAKEAVRVGVKHFIFMSSVHAVAADCNGVITPETQPHPVSAYGGSKLAAEKVLQQELLGSACAWTILRPPLVYGPGNKANFGLLLKLVKTGIPLPLDSVCNRRSFIYVENLSDLIETCLANSKAFGKVFLPSDGEDVSTPELIRAIARANASVEQGAGLPARISWSLSDPSPLRSGCAYRSERSREQGVTIGEQKSETGEPTRHSPRLFPFPEKVLEVMGRLPGLGALKKLTSSLYVDSEPIRRELGWTPPFTMEEGVRRTLAQRQ